MQQNAIKEEVWKGIDVSDNQNVIDWEQAAAAGVQFAILRSVRGSGKTDYQFAANLAGCRTQGIPVAVYKYTYAVSQQAAAEEARQVTQLLKNHNLRCKVYWDVEDKSLKPLGQEQLTACIKAAQSAIEAAGLEFALYIGNHVAQEKWFDLSQFACDVWVARYPDDGKSHTLDEEPPADKKPDIGREISGWQWSSKGSVLGINGFVDLDIYYFEFKEEKEEMTEAEIRKKMVDTAAAWIGRKESDGTHKPIIDLYNSYSPLPRGYKVKYTDSWCAAFCSAVAIAAGYTDVIPLECSCGNLIALFKALGRWIEDDTYMPAPGDYIFYDWDDGGSGDCTGWPEHVGIVAEVSGSAIRVIEGNKNDAVGDRDIAVNGKYIRGYGVPDYASKATPETVTPTEPAVPKYYGLPSIQKCFDACGLPSSKTDRQKIAVANGMTDYSWTAEENMKLMELWIQGKLIQI